MPNILGLEGWTVLERKENEREMVVAATYDGGDEYCVHCLVPESRMKKHGVQEQHFIDTPTQGKAVMIKITRQRYKCPLCGRTAQQYLPDMDDKRNMTKRLVQYIQRRSLERTFAEVALDVGRNEKTIRNIFLDYVRGLDSGHMPVTPEWLGIDELYLIGKPRCMLTNVADNCLVDILEERTKPVVKDWLSNHIDSSAVKVVTMDMWKPYRDAALEMLPNAVCIVDKFHVVKIANHCLDAVRKSLREGMDAKQRRRQMRARHLILKRRKNLDDKEFSEMERWTDEVPALFSAYQAKEDFFDIYDAGGRNEATELYDIWKATLDPQTAAAFFELIRAVDNWRPEIFNYFDTPVTNAYTESVNGLTRVVNRMGRGYSFEAIRAKMLYGHAKHVTRAKAFSGLTEMWFSSTDDFGVSLPHLIKLVEAIH